ncbi:hypothetical protein GTR02_19345 [Kineococcus sp. R8]|uniref:hypothetical protein n=1 Tax=Kineococcus siccus TaxID=2696567 RepID=UPI0014132886|nr:hypothetical protein [Kineococcus siccus]
MAARDEGTSRTTDVLFDIRTVIGVLFAVYGGVCLVTGLVSFTAADSAKTGGVNLNLWAGLGMLVLAAGFLAWSLTKPLHPPATPAEEVAGTPAPQDDDGPADRT